MFSVTVATSVFTNKLREYQEATGKALAVVLREQAALLAQRLVKLTFPFSASQGRKRVSIDIGRVFLRNSWFEETFQFTKQKLGERIKALVRRKNTDALERIFDNTQRLRLVHIESFDRSRYERMRKRGRILVPKPNSFPIAEQSKVNSLVAEKKKAVGTAKAGWAQCVAQLGKSVPAWLNKAGTGKVTDQSQESEKPSITLTNSVGYFAALDSRANIVQRSLEGRARDMQKSAEHQLRLAAKEAGL